ncbi:MAG TPA: hypothetical protein VFA50_13335 [Stellaceae bacterium]|nr:hypothetical protein [Stellaceae bacterium]
MNCEIAMTPIAERSVRCEEGLRLRQRLNKLRWMRLDTEADRLAAEIARLECDLPRWLSPGIPETD